MTILAIFATAALTVMVAITIYNFFAFPRLVVAQPSPGTAVSVLIPARNEAQVIGETVATLCRQTHATFELLVLDDHSEDNTAATVCLAAAGDPRVQVLVGRPLPSEWSGKNWACHQLAEAARHDLLLFTDADVQWQPDALAALLAMQERNAADLLTIWPTQITLTWSERLIIPLMNFAVWAYLPVGLAHHAPYPVAAAANGQCLLFRRASYCACGGHAAVRKHVLDDVLLAQRVKASGGRLRMADGAGLLSCRMYDSWTATYFGYAKNILAGHANSPLLLILSTLFHLLLFVGPWLWLAGGFAVAMVYWPWWPLLLIATGLFLRFVVAAATWQRWQEILWMPVAVLLMTAIAGQSLWWHYHGGPRWKGRVLTHA
ncbi:MAG TPA: glycosyltransferase [Caldilineaceae bacterium]|nr:glycosyltransferase [Caldilineaceae bacterium]